MSLTEDELNQLSTGNWGVRTLYNQHQPNTLPAKAAEEIRSLRQRLHMAERAPRGASEKGGGFFSQRGRGLYEGQE